MLIGEIAAAAGMSRDTIRYYEKKGLLRRPERRENRYKEYASGDVGRLRFIRDLQLGGFTLREIRNLFELAETKAVQCGEVAPFIESKREEIEDKIRALQTAQAQLEGFFAGCTGNTPSDICTPVAERMN